MKRQYLPFRMWVYTVPVDHNRGPGYSSERRIERGYDYPTYPVGDARTAIKYAGERWPGQNFYLAHIDNGVIVDVINPQGDHVDEPALLAELNRNLNWKGKADG